MLQHLEKITDTAKNYWQIELKGSTVLVEYGKIGGKATLVEKDCENSIAALQYYKQALLKKMNAGYLDAKGKVQIGQFQDEVYETYLANNELDKALAWLAYYGDLLDGSYEDLLLQKYLDNKDFVAAEKYVLSKIQVVKDANIIVRQVRHLGLINPMLCRFMIGNLPPNPNPIMIDLYYQDLAMAQARIGLFEMVNVTLKNMEKDRTKLTYLTYLLETIHPTITAQKDILEKALSYLDKVNLEEKEGLLLIQKLKEAAHAMKVPELVEAWEVDK